VFGIWIAVQSGAFSAPWLQLKLVLVVVLSALHGMLSGRLRRNNPAGPMRVQIQSIIVVAGLIGVAFLAVVKPF
jgi:putative membrane protein